MDRRVKAASTQTPTRPLAHDRLWDGALGPHEPPFTSHRIRRRRGFGVLRRIARVKKWKLALLVFATSIVSTGAFVYFGPASLSAAAPLQNATLTDFSGRPLGEIRPEQNRVVVGWDQVPLVVKNAFVAAEDERFYSHLGVDPLAIVRAIYANFRGHHQGASTITQQYVKNTIVGSQRSLWRKIREAVLAVRIDRKFSKEKILLAYLNSIYLGNGAYGVQAASRLYFGHDIAEATLPEAATLAGVTASPTRFDPRRHPEAARSRRDYVLHRMATLKMISTEDEATARQVEIVLAPPVKIVSRAPAFVDWVRSTLLKDLGEDDLYRRGLRVTTTIDLDVQAAAEAAVADVLDRPGDPDAAVVTIDVASGGVRAMVGGRASKLGDFNLATQGARQPGSAFKPIVLATALSQGKTLDDTYRAPSSIRLSKPDGTTFRISNYDHRGYGRLSLRRATANSVNTVYAQLILDAGPDNVAAMAHRLGISSSLDAVPALALGTSDVTPLELATAYATIAREGAYLKTTPLSHVSDAEGKDIVSWDVDPRAAARRLSATAADDVIEALKEVVRNGTGRPARIPNYVTWGKTGTTEQHADAWFCGAAGGAVTCVWVGYPQGRIPMNDVHGIKVTGNSFPAQIFKRVMVALLDKYHPADNELIHPSDGRRRARTPSVSATEPSEEPSAEPSPSPTQTKGVLPLPLISRSPQPADSR